MCVFEWPLTVGRLLPRIHARERALGEREYISNIEIPEGKDGPAATAVLQEAREVLLLEILQMEHPDGGEVD